jgi:hypothetical protein
MDHMWLPDGLVSEVFCAERLLVGLRPGHRLARRAGIRLAVLCAGASRLKPLEPVPRVGGAPARQLCLAEGRCARRSFPDPSQPPRRLLLSAAGRGGLELTARGLDAIDGSPLPDIKPYRPGFSPPGSYGSPAGCGSSCAITTDRAAARLDHPQIRQQSPCETAVQKRAPVRTRAPQSAPLWTTSTQAG